MDSEDSQDFVPDARDLLDDAFSSSSEREPEPVNRRTSPRRVATSPATASRLAVAKKPVAKKASKKAEPDGDDEDDEDDVAAAKDSGIVDPKTQMQRPDKQIRVSILPESVLYNSSNSSTIVTTLPLLGANERFELDSDQIELSFARFMINHASSTCVELQSLRHPPSSWFVGDSVVQDGTLMLGTPIDPVFLLLPHLEAARGFAGLKNANKSESESGSASSESSSSSAGKFQDLSTLLQPEGASPCATPGCLHLIALFTPPSSEDVPPNPHVESLKCICDTREIYDAHTDSVQLLVRLSDDKLLAWLHAKALRLAEALGSLDSTISTSSAKASTFVEATEKKITARERNEAALGFLSEYIPRQLLDQVAERLGVSSFHRAASVPLPSFSETDGSSRKRPADQPLDEEALERQAVRQKFTHNPRHKQLEKSVSKNQNRITSFFTMGAKKE